MTYDSNIDTTYRTAMEEVRDKLSGMTGWSLVEDSLATNDFFVLEAGATGQHVILSMQGANPEGSTPNTAHHIGINHGYDWDVSNQEFNGQQWTAEAVEISTRSVDDDQAVQYWLQYQADKGFVLAMRSDWGWTDDRFAWVAYNIVDEYWDSSITSDPREQPQAVIALGSSGYVSDPGVQGWGRDVIGGGLGSVRDQTGWGMLNPDRSHDNYVYTPWIVVFTLSVNSDTGMRPALGECDLFLRDMSGDFLFTGDVVQDGSGTDLYEILHFEDERIAIKME